MSRDFYDNLMHSFLFTATKEGAEYWVTVALKSEYATDRQVYNSIDIADFLANDKINDKDTSRR
jgi:hypothetical protein